MNKKAGLFLIVALISVLVGSVFILRDENAAVNELVDLEIENARKIINEAGYVSPISVQRLRSLTYGSGPVELEEELESGSNYKRYIAHYTSDGNKIFGLLTMPNDDPPEDGYKAIVFIHGYIPPRDYVTTEKYVAYVDNLAKNGFVVFKIDLRGHGISEGQAAGSYFSPGYTIDAVNALKSLQNTDNIDPNGIGLWGHSMAGNAGLRAMEVTNEFKAGVIWAGAVYSYSDFREYGLSDSSYVRGPSIHDEESKRDNSEEVRKLRDASKNVDFTNDFWKSVSLTENINYLESPIQLHHAKDDQVVDINYQRDLIKVLEENNKVYEAYEYDGGGHNINSPYFETAMQRTVEFFKKYL